ncbi:uncharacterized protein TNCV_3780151 [Trichonephila clavipes]|nr:uncharacterized protein TNCV_3780151 [Trichonephila clavipes]
MKFNIFTYLSLETFSPSWSEVTKDIPFTLTMSSFSYPKGDTGFQERDEEDIETWMACDAEDSGFEMLNDDEIVTSVQEESDPLDDETDEEEDNTTKVARVHQMLTRFLR